MKFYAASLCLLTLAFTTVLPAGEELFQQSIDLKSIAGGNGVEVKQEATGIKVSFPAVSKENRWPGIIVHLPADCSKFTGVKVDCALVGGFSGTFAIRLNDSQGGKIFEYFTIDSSDRFSYYMPLDNNRLNKNAMSSMSIYLSHPPFASEFLFYSVTLVNDLPEKLKTALEKFRSFGDASLYGRLKKLEADTMSGILSPDKSAEMLQVLERELEQTKRTAAFKETQRLYPGVPFGITAFSSMEKALPDAHFGIPGKTPEKLSLSLARNESEMLQLVTIAPDKTPLKDVRISLSDFSLKGAPERKLENMTAAPVGFVTTTRSRVPEAWFGRYPDPILEFADTVPEVKAGELQSWVIRCKTTEATAPGVYTGSVTVSSQGGKAVIPMEIRVYSFALPQTPSLVTATSVYGSRALGKHKKEFERWMLKNYHINPFSIYSDTGSYGEPVLPSIEEYLAARKDGLNFIPILYLKLPRQALHTGKGIAPGKSKELWNALPHEQQKTYSAEWKQKYLEILRKRIPELKKAGLYDIAACYGFDEASSSEWEAVVDLLKILKAEFPDLKVVSTAVDESYGGKTVLKNYLDAWIAGVPQYHFARAEEARGKGRKVWYYTVKMTIDGDSLADIRAELGSRAFANKVDGWLVWTVSRWNDNKPITSVPETGWSPESYPGDNGGGSYFCMGPDGRFLPTLRAEAIRDGIEDYEYFTMLKKLSEKRGKSDPLRIKAEALLDSLSRHPGTSAERETELRAEAAALLEAMNG